MSTRKRRLLRFVVVAATGLVALYLVATLALAPLVRSKLQQLVADHLHATLDIGSLSYRFPYGVTVRDASFTTDPQHGNIELLRVKRVDLSLARLPFRKGPIVIK